MPFLLRLLFLPSRRYALLCNDLLPRPSYLEQFIEEGAVVRNRIAQLLGVRRSTVFAHRDGLRRALICHNVRVID